MIKITNLNVIFEERNILSNINLSINAGDFIHIIGPNGGGKSTLVKTLVGLNTHYSGDIKINKNIGYLPQNIEPKAYFPITVLEVIKTGFKTSKEIDIEAISFWASELKVTHLLSESISTLSGGERQRIYFIRALVGNPDILILDEPTSALDPEFRIEIYQLLAILNRDKNTTVINITHHLDHSITDHDRIILLNQSILLDTTYEQYIGDDQNV